MILHCACCDNNLPVLQDLFSVFNYDQLDPNSQKLCRFPYPSQAVECLLLNKANANATIPHNESVWAPRFNKSEGTRTPGNLTPLMIKAKYCRKDDDKSIVLLLKYKADIHAKDAQGESILTSLTFKYKANTDVSKSCQIKGEILKALLDGGIDLGYVNPQIQETNLTIKKQLDGLSDYERLSVNPKVKEIMDEHRLKVAQSCHQVIQKMEESLELPIPLKRIIGGYLMDYPLVNKFPFREQEIRSSNK